MQYYKVIVDSQIIGVVNSLDFRRVQAKHNIILATNEDSGQYVQLKESLYRDAWMVPITSDKPYTVASVLAISEDEYNILAETFAEDETPIEYEEPPVEEIPEPEPDEIELLTIDYIKAAKIDQLKRACSNAITSGFDIELSGVVKHFSFTTEDQMNLQMAQLQILNGAEKIPYHADGEETTYFQAEEIIAIINAGTLHKDSCSARFNCLKRYVKSLEDKYVVYDITFDSEIPAEFRSEVLEDILADEYKPETLAEIASDKELNSALDILLGL